MRVKSASSAAAGGESPSASTSASATASDKASGSSTTPGAPQASMGYTKGVAPAVTYPQPAYPNFFDLLDSPDAADTDSPLPAELEEDFLDMLAESDIGMYPPPPYQGPTGGYQSNGYSTYPNQYMQYPNYGNYGYQAVQGAPPQNNVVVNPNSNAAKVITTTTKPLPNNAQIQMIETGANQGDVYSQGERLMNDLQATVVDQKPVMIDPLRTIAKKVGITDNSGDNSSTHSNESEYYEQTSARHSVSSESGSGGQSVSPSTSAGRSKATADKRKTSTTPAAAGTSRSRTKKEVVAVDVPEEVLYEEAKARPIKHRKEPDIVESKDRSVRNAINARVNRQKHKLYVDSLEQDLEDMRKANAELERKHQGALDKVAEMQKHITYLENVIANDISISKILTSLGNVENVTLSSSLSSSSSSRKRKLPRGEEDDDPMDLSEPAAKVSGGVCLHVDKQNVSIEFCEKCAEKAQANLNGEST